MKHFKLTFLLIVLMSMVGANAYAQNEPFKVDGIYYRYSPYQDYSVDVVHPNATAVEEDDQSISIPSSYLGSITIPSFISVTKTVTDMNEWGGQNTYEETHSYSVENIGSCAFYGSEITSIVIPNSVTIILSGAFASCTKLSSIIIPNSVVAINQYAFSSCSGLNSVDIPQSVTYLGEGAFDGCDNLTSVTVRMEVPVSIDESVFSNRTNATLYVPAGCKEAYMAAPYWQDFKEIVEMSPIITFADYYVKDICVSKWDTDGDGELSEDEAAAVTSLGFAFKNNRNIKTFDEFRYFTGLTSIRDEEFYYCTKLSSIIIPKNVTSIGSRAFFECGSLNSLSIPSGVNNISNAAFVDCGLGLTSITVERGNTKYDSRNNCNAIIETETNKLLLGCNNTIIPNSVTSIGSSAFSHCMKMTTINIPDGVTNIGDWAFYNCEKLTSVVIPDLVTSIGEDAFWHCDNLLSVTIGEKVESIGRWAFSDCYNLTSVTIPKSVTSIGDEAFYYCSNLTSVTVEIETPLSITSNTFSNRANATLYVPKGCKAAYEAADYWKEFKEIVELSPNIEFADANVKALCVANWDTDGDGELSEAEAAAVTSLGTIFKGNKSINTFKELNYFTGLTIIGKSAFEDCSNLVSITIPNSVTTIGNMAFDECSALTSVDIPNSVISIGDFAFADAGLTSVTIPNSVNSIGNAAFYDCYGLTSVNIPYGVNSIGASLFWSCINLISVTIPESVTSIGKDAFRGCISLPSVTIPSSVTTINDRAFMACKNLTSITIPSSVITIGEDVFTDCDNLSIVSVEADTPISISSSTFSNRTNITLYVPVGSKAAYEAANYWKEFKEIVEMGPASEPGDLNGDGIINGIDLVAQTNLIMTDQYNAAADLNNDGFVNGLDYVIMVNLILSETSAPAMQAAGSNRVAATSSLSIEDFDIKAGETKELFINLSNPNTDLTLLQFDLRLPEGLSIAVEDGDYAIDIAGRTTWKKHSLMAKATNGITRFLLASNSNALIDGDNGNVISIKLTASDGFTCGDIMLENQLLVSPNAEDMMPADYVYSVGNTTSINAIMAGQPVDVYTLTGSKVLSGATSLDGLSKGMYIVNGKKVIVK